MMSDAITHTLLLGIVLAFLATHSLTSPFLIVGAASVGLLTVWMAEALQHSHRVSEDSAIGLTFPLLFSIAIILITRYADSVHLDADAVLLGELAFAPFDRMLVGGTDIGPKAAWSMGSVLLINLAALLLFFKELKLATFDPVLAALMGFAPVWLHYGLMTAVSMTAVAAFQAVGSILVVAFMIGPPASAYLLTDDLGRMVVLSTLIGGLNAVAGYWAAAWLDISIAGSIAVVTGLSFLGIFILSPIQGLLSAVRRRAHQRREYRKRIVLLHLRQHEGSEDEAQESGVDSIHRHLGWPQALAKAVLRCLEEEGRIRIEDGVAKPAPHQPED